MPRQPPETFTNAPLRPTTLNAPSLAANPSLHSQTSQHSLRSNASTASARSRQPRQPRDVFASGMTRRGATPKLEDEVFADDDSEQDGPAQHHQRQVRRVRHGSPESKQGRAKGRQDEESDFVNRQPDGSYLLGMAGFGDTTAVPRMSPPKTEEEVYDEEADAHYTAVARQFFTSGASLAAKSSKKHEEELEQYRTPMLVRMREQVVRQLEEERWRYERVGSG